MIRKKRRVNNYNIVTEVCNYYCIDEERFFSRSRKRTLALARQVAMYLMRHHGTVSTYIGIKDFFAFHSSIRNHATVMHHYKLNMQLVDTDTYYFKKYNTILQMVKSDLNIVEVEELMEVIQRLQANKESQIELKEKLTKFYNKDEN